MGILEIKEPFISYGNNLFDTTSRNFAIHYREPVYELTTDNCKISFNNNEEFSYYPDSLTNKEYYQNFMKAYIQQYNNRMIKNDFNINQ